MTGLIFIDAPMTEAGAHSWALIPAVPVDPVHSAIYRRYIAEGRHGAMAWAARHLDVRDDPRLLLREQGGPPVAALLMCLFAYPSVSHAEAAGAPRVPYVADYALTPSDYHLVCQRRLAAVAEEISKVTSATTRVYCDTAPLRERYWAARAGLGFITRNNQFNVTGQGSSFHIAAIAIGGDGNQALLAPGIRQLTQPPVAPCPPGCRLCVNACPTTALRADGDCDAARCLSYLTIEAPAPRLPLHPVPTSLMHRRLSAPHVYGCDICRRVCPFSTPTVCSPLPISDLSPANDALMPPESWLAIGPAEFHKRLPESAMQRPGLKRLRRNL